jgi:DNA-directed RNA polymerase subunit M/transcription elongation factor TFIIS
VTVQKIDIAAADCPECETLLVLDRPAQAEVFTCPVCEADLQVRGGYIEEMSYGEFSPIHHLNEETR